MIEKPYNPKIYTPSDGFVFLFDGRGSRGSIKCIDLSDKGNHGAITGASWKNSPVNTPVLSFDGIDDYIKIDDDPTFDITKNFSVLAWLRITEAPEVDAFYNITSKFEWTSGDKREWFLDITNDQQLRISFSTDGIGDNYFYGGAAENEIVTLNRWMHVGFVYDGSRVKMYRNGIEIQSDVFSSDIYNGTADVYIGAMNAGTYALFNGMMAYVAILHRPLSAAEISQKYNSERNLYGA